MERRPGLRSKAGDGAGRRHDRNRFFAAMKIFASLRNRIFLTSALLAVLSIGVAIYLVSVRVSRELEQQLQREIVSTGGLVEQLRTTRGQIFTMMARLIADAPKLKAAV